MIEPGRIVIKNAGREAGKYAVIVNKINDSFVTISGPKSITCVKRRKCNIEHIRITDEKFEIKEDATDVELERLWKDSDLLAKFGIIVPVKRHKEETKTEKKSKK